MASTTVAAVREEVRIVKERIRKIKKRLAQMKEIKKKCIEAFELHKNEYIQTDVEWLTLFNVAKAAHESSLAANNQPSPVSFEDTSELNSTPITLSTVVIVECKEEYIEPEYESTDDD